MRSTKKWEETVMSITKMFEEAVKYVTEAFARIFGPHEEDMPDIGVQPFECDPYYGNSEGKG
jgi:hypothetical protein